jgi:hypothetical protein
VAATDTVATALLQLLLTWPLMWQRGLSRGTLHMVRMLFKVSALFCIHLVVCEAYTSVHQYIS